MNTGKTQIMLCDGSYTLSLIDTPQIDIDGERLVCEPIIKDLGVHLDRHMTFSKHVITWYTTCVQGHSATFPTAGRPYFLTEQATRFLVGSLALGKPRYCSVAWGGIGLTDAKRLQKVVNFAARVIFNKKKYESVSLLLRQLNWASVQNGLLLDLACMLYVQSRA